MEVKKIKLSKIHIEKSMRAGIREEKLVDLVNSMNQVGLLAPILVEEVEGGKYNLIAGSRRVMAAKALGWREIPAVVRKRKKEGGWEEMWHENFCREDVTAVEEAQWFSWVMRTYKVTPRVIAKQIGRTEEYVRQRLRFLEAHPMLVEAVAERKIDFCVGRELMRIKDEKTLRMYLEWAITSGCTVAQARRWVEDWLHEMGYEARDREYKDHVREMNERRKGEAKKPICWACDRSLEEYPYKWVPLCQECELQLVQDMEQIYGERMEETRKEGS